MSRLLSVYTWCCAGSADDTHGSCNSCDWRRHGSLGRARSEPDYLQTVGSGYEAISAIGARTRKVSLGRTTLRVASRFQRGIPGLWCHAGIEPWALPSGDRPTITASTSIAAIPAPHPFHAGRARALVTKSLGRSQRSEFESKVSQYHDDLYRFAYWLTRDHSVADEALQEGLIRAWKSWDSLREKNSVKNWLLTIVRRECARSYERKRYEMIDIDELPPSDQHTVTIEDDGSVRDIERAILRLGESYREPLILQVLMGYSAAEIAAEMGIRPGAVLTRLCRARQQLAKDLAIDAAE